jgi:uncharacterized Ntn-hydrolase superfamily protein
MNRTGARQKVTPLLPSLTPIFAHCPRGAYALNIFATFSMVARCPNTFSLGVCTSSAAPAVRSRVSHVEKGVGAIATQANTNILYGINGLKLLKKGFSPRTALETMLRDDPDRETRQVIIIDNQGRTAAFTGKSTIDWKGHLIGKGYVVAGNMLVGSKVVKAMAQTFESSEGELAERLMKALEAGQGSGGDKRGKTSAALLVVSKEQKETRSFIDLRVDEHPDPVHELRRIFEIFRKKTFGNSKLPPVYREKNTHNHSYCWNQ